MIRLEKGNPMGKHDIALVTDSTCDIPESLIQQYDIGVIPEVVVWGEEILRDRVDITPEVFYQRLETDKRHPSTTLPSPSDFEKVYKNALADGARELMVLTVSSAMSGTYQLAKQVGDQMDMPVHVIDSKGPTMSLGWQVLAAARAREAGAVIQGMIAAAERVRQTLVQIVCLDTLEYLHRGGRIGGATKFIGSLLDLKPLVQINHQTGLVEPGGRARTRRKSVDMLVDLFFEKLDIKKNLHIAVLHGDALEEAQALAERIHQEYAPLELLLNITGPVLGINTGPRALALCGYTD
jgi:DegV family protein with EDD domain